MPTGPYSGITINSAKRLLTAQFSAAEPDAAQIMARALIEAVTGFSPADQIARGTEFLSAEDFEALSGLAERVTGGEPLDHILGYREFWKDRFIVNADVLTPRPETEGVIERALAIFKTRPPASILDLGTGSGALALSLAGEFPQAEIVATDQSAAALNIARQNADALGRRVTFFNGDWFSALTDKKSQFDLIVSNPPYITGAAMTTLDRTVAAFDPHLALYGGEDGLEAYRQIISNAPDHLLQRGWLIVEIGYDQGTAVAALFESAGFSKITLDKDLSGHDRVVSGQIA